MLPNGEHLKSEVVVNLLISDVAFLLERYVRALGILSHLYN